MLMGLIQTDFYLSFKTLGDVKKYSHPKNPIPFKQEWFIMLFFTEKTPENTCL